MARTVRLEGDLERLVDDQLRTGRFSDESAVIEAGLRLLAGAERLTVDDIRASIEAGRRAGTLRDADAVFDAALAVARGEAV
jgi:putative addiction module CopG family antidote